MQSNNTATYVAQPSTLAPSPISTNPPLGQTKARGLENASIDPPPPTNRQASRTKKKSLPAVLTPDLLQLADWLRAAFAALPSIDVPHRYNIGQAVLTARRTTSYGEGAVSRLAKVVGVPAKTLRVHGSVVEAWPDPAAFTLLFNRTGKDGLRLSWSHLTELATVEATRREAVIELVLSDGWSVGRLRSAKAEFAPSTTAKKEGSGSLRATTSAVLRLVDGPRSLANLPQLVAEMASGDPAKAKADLEELREALARLKNLAEGGAMRVTAELGKGTPPQHAAPAIVPTTGLSPTSRLKNWSIQIS